MASNVRRRDLLLQQATSAVLFIAILAVAGWLTTRYKIEADWTAGNRNTLTEASQKLLLSMPDPITVRVFLYPRSELRQSLDADFNRYRRFKDGITVEYIDPSTSPQKVQAFNISRAGEVVIEYQGRRETLAATTEQAITTALQRLSDSGERWVLFLEGHGEPGINDTDDNGLSDFAGLLRNKGLKVRSLNLATHPSVPDNATVLVVPSPPRALLEGEVALIDAWVERGGNLLWLLDPEAPTGPPALAERLGVQWKAGTGILLESAALGLPPFVYITTQYPPNPVTREFPQNALFPLVRGFAATAVNGWEVKPLLTTTENAWLETGSLEGEVELQEGQGDTPGPLTLGVTLERAAPGEADGLQDGEADSEETDSRQPAKQRAAVIGDSDFLTNGYVGQLGNSLLGLNLVQWLASRDAQINIDIPKAPDRSLWLPQWGFYSIYVLFAFLLPAALVGTGVTRWVLRRRR